MRDPRSGGLCPREESQALRSRFGHAEGRLQLKTVRAESTRKRESRQTREQASERPAIVRTGDTLLPVAHAGGERGVYLRLRFCAFEEVVLFSEVKASRDGLDPTGDNFDDTCAMLCPPSARDRDVNGKRPDKPTLFRCSSDPNA